MRALATRWRWRGARRLALFGSSWTLTTTDVAARCASFAAWLAARRAPGGVGCRPSAPRHLVRRRTGGGAPGRITHTHRIDLRATITMLERLATRVLLPLVGVVPPSPPATVLVVPARRSTPSLATGYHDARGAGPPMSADAAVRRATMGSAAAPSTVERPRARIVAGQPLAGPRTLRPAPIASASSLGRRRPLDLPVASHTPVTLRMPERGPSPSRPVAPRPPLTLLAARAAAPRDAQRALAAATAPARATMVVAAARPRADAQVAELPPAARPEPARTPAPPPVDVARLTDQVYESLERRIRLERQRRGYR